LFQINQDETWQEYSLHK